MKRIVHFILITTFLFSFNDNVLAQIDSTASDSLLLQQIQEQMEAASQNEGNQAPQIQPAVQSVRATSANTNPNVSVIGDFGSFYTSKGDKNFDAYVSGVELNFSSVIDPYARADFYPVFEGEDGELNAKIEEAYLTTLTLPFNLQLKAGKFRQTFGRINRVHGHALPIIDLPVAFENFMGEALIDQGFSLSWLIPNPHFYQELVIELTRGPDESPIFDVSKGNIPLKLAHLKNFWALGDNSTLELGLSAAWGANHFDQTSTLGGVNLTYKWKPIQYNTYKSFEWQSELFLSNQDMGSEMDNVQAWGMYSWMQIQLGRRWFLTGMYSYSELPDDSDFSEESFSATLAWYATEFQKIEMGPKLYSDNGLFDNPSFSGLFRWIFVIGSHGAHQY